MFQTLNLPPTASSLQFQSQSSHPPSDRRSPKSAAVRCTFAVRDRPAASVSAPASLYEVLRVKRDASLTEIKLAYRNMAKLCHPDTAVDGSDGRGFIEIREAYETLSDPASRAMYDVSLGLGFRTTSFGGECVSAGAGRRRSGFNPTRRWETDQCW